MTTTRTTQLGEGPLVTVIMAAYNSEQYIAEAVDSVLGQTYGNWELLCVDDASTDRTREIVERYAEKDERVRLICNEKNKGASGARNAALAQARGEYVAILDSDDVALPDRLERCLRVFQERPEVDVIRGLVIQIDENGRQQGIWRPYTANKGYIHSSHMFRTAAARRVGGYDEAFPVANDTDLMMRLSLDHSFFFVAEPLAKYRWYGGQLSVEHAVEQAVYGRIARERAEAMRNGDTADLRILYERLSKDRMVRSWAYYGAGWKHLEMMESRQARTSFAQALKLRRTYLAAAIWWALSFMPAFALRPSMALWEMSKAHARRLLPRQADPFGG